MRKLDRREILCAGMAVAVPIGGVPLFSGCQQSEDNSTNDVAQGNAKDSRLDDNKQVTKGKNMQIQYLEIVTPEHEALCKQYSAIHGINFSEPDMNLGNARTAKLESGGVIAIRGPMRETETPVVRPYTLVEDIDASVSAAKEAGAEVAISRMEIPGHGTIAIVIQGGIECGLWQA